MSKESLKNDSIIFSNEIIASSRTNFVAWAKFVEYFLKC